MEPGEKGRNNDR